MTDKRICIRCANRQPAAGETFCWKCSRQVWRKTSQYDTSWPRVRKHGETYRVQKRPLSKPHIFNTLYEALEDAAVPEDESQCRRLGCVAEGRERDGIVLCDEHALKRPKVRTMEGIRNRRRLVAEELEGWFAA